MTLPAELQTLLDEIDACEREAGAVIEGLDDDTVNARAPDVRAGTWSVAQCLNHLATMNEFYLRGMVDRVNAARAAGRGPFAGLHPTPIGRWFARSMEPPPKIKLKAPLKDPDPGRRYPIEGLVEAFQRSHAPYRALVQASAGVDVNRVIVPNPFHKQIRMRMATILLIIPAHDRRHLWQAANVRRSLQR